MSKLIYSPSASVLEATYSNIRNTDLTQNGVYRSVAFTGDGYMYTHGKKFKLFLVTDQYEGLSFGALDGTISLGIDGVNVGTATVVQSIVADENDRVAANTVAGVTTISHKAYFLTLPGTNGQVGSGTSIPLITIDAYGHISLATGITIDLTKVLPSAATSTTSNPSATLSYYLLGVTGATALNPKYLSTIKFDTEGNIYEKDTKLSAKYAPISHVTVSNETVSAVATASDLGHVKLYDLYSNDYAATSGTAATPKAVNEALNAAKLYANGLIAAQDSMIFVGTATYNGTITNHNDAVVDNVTDNTTKITDLDYKTGWTFRFTSSGTFQGQEVEVGDMIIAVKNKGTNFNINDWSIIQTNISGALTATSNLSGILYGTGSRAISSLAFTSGVLTSDGSSISFVNANTLWRDIQVNGTSIGTIAAQLKSGTYASVSFSNNEITVEANASSIIGTAESLKLKLNSTEFTYAPSTASTLNIGSHLTLAQSDGNWTLKHATVGTAVSTAKLGKITTDAYGHVTSFTEVTSLPNANSFIIKNNSGTSMLSYKGDAEKVLKILNGTDISLSLANNNGTLELTPSITHKYRPIQFYNASDSNATSVLVNTDSETFSLVAGSNITFRNTTAQGGALTKGTLVIEATDTWRDIQAYAFASNAMTQASIGTTALKFNNDFIWSSNELGICWTEIDANGVVTYL